MSGRGMSQSPTLCSKRNEKIRTNVKCAFYEDRFWEEERTWFELLKYIGVFSVSAIFTRYANTRCLSSKYRTDNADGRGFQNRVRKNDLLLSKAASNLPCHRVWNYYKNQRFSWKLFAVFMHTIFPKLVPTPLPLGAAMRGWFSPPELDFKPPPKKLPLHLSLRKNPLSSNVRTFGYRDGMTWN